MKWAKESHLMEDTEAQTFSLEPGHLPSCWALRRFATVPIPIGLLSLARFPPAVIEAVLFLEKQKAIRKKAIILLSLAAFGSLKTIIKLSYCLQFREEKTLSLICQGSCPRILFSVGSERM